MKKIVSIEMSEATVSILVSVKNSCDSTVDSCSFNFPFSVISPRTSLQIASILAQDASIPQCESNDTASSNC